MFESKRLTVIAGPCSLESRDMCMHVAEFACKETLDLGVEFIFKGSFDKANRTSADSFRGNGMDQGLSILSEIKKEFNVPVLTDVHETHQVDSVAKEVDVLQIPAYLCRQTNLIQAAVKTIGNNKYLSSALNIKKGQFLAPWDSAMLVKKAKTFNPKITRNQLWLTERGTTFGYNNLVVDMKGIHYLKETGYPVIMDATHAVQEPGANGLSSGGKRFLVPLLAKAAVAAGVEGVFLEIHPDPDQALSDGPNMLNLSQFRSLINQLSKIHELVNTFS
tara:strand:+ start:2579 stop:3406 length:828 start_codon:yes stop_codon:yes gene_type:complete